MLCIYMYVRVDAILRTITMEQESEDMEHALTYPECPMELHLTGMNLIVVTLLIIVVLYYWIHEQQHNVQSSRQSIKRVVLSSSVIKTHSLSDPMKGSIVTDLKSSRQSRCVRFAETPSVRCIQSLYKPEDFYNDPQ